MPIVLVVVLVLDLISVTVDYENEDRPPGRTEDEDDLLSDLHPEP